MDETFACNMNVNQFAEVTWTFYEEGAKALYYIDNVTIEQ